MKSKLVLSAAACVLSVVCAGQWIEKMVVLPDSFAAVRNPGASCVNTGSSR
jgi:hypothetical protein